MKDGLNLEPFDQIETRLAARSVYPRDSSKATRPGALFRCWKPRSFLYAEEFLDGVSIYLMSHADYQC
jgi:hypothetical protein